jgi:hypothetical protein
MKKKKALAAILIAALLIGIVPVVNVVAVNPYLPLWEHLPDGEPRVFEDPDNPGLYRIYIIGSHDVRFTDYCGPDIRVWSAPVDDLTNWRDDGPVFTFQDPITELWDIMFAPDMVEVLRRDENGERTIREYYLYPHSRGPGREAMVAVSSRPDGPFVPINLADNGRSLRSGSVMGFDPAVFIDYIDDPNDPDYEIGFRAYGYWGFQRAFAAELDQNTMWSVRPGTQVINHFIPASERFGVLRDPAGTVYPHIFDDEDLTAFNYFEAFSIRRVGNKYVNVFSGYSGPEYGLPSTNSALRYMYADSPLGPWRSGGVLVDSRAPVLNQHGTALQTTGHAHNTHGGLEYINGQWYVFYHRPPRGFGYARQAVVAPVHIEWDETSVADGGRVTIRAYDPFAENNIWTARASNGMEYTGAEVTSEGFQIYGLPPYAYYSAGIACYMSNGHTLQNNWDVWDSHMPIENMGSGHIVGYKYFGFGGLSQPTRSLPAFDGTRVGNNTEFNLWLTPRNGNELTIGVWLNGPWDNDTWNGTRMGEIVVPASTERDVMHFTLNVAEYVDHLTQKNAIFLVAEGAGTIDLIGLGFSSDVHSIERRVAPTVNIFADGEEIELPRTPVRFTPLNGIMSYDIFEAIVLRPQNETGIPTVTATASDPSVAISITQADYAFGTATVTFDYNGVVKTYNIVFEPDTPNEEIVNVLRNMDGLTNFALASEGATATVSEGAEGDAANIIDGDSNHPGNDLTGTNPSRIRWSGDADRWAEVTFAQPQPIHRVHVISQASNDFAGIPDFTTTTNLGLNAIRVSYWDGNNWVVIGRGAGDNTFAVQQFGLAEPVTTDRIRVDLPSGTGMGGWTRIVQIEAWGGEIEEEPPAEALPNETHNTPESIQTSVNQNARIIFIPLIIVTVVIMGVSVLIGLKSNRKK